MPVQLVFQFPALGASSCSPPTAPPIDREPRGGQHFPTEPVEFKVKAVQQVQELHSSRSMPTDTALLSSLSQACPAEPADDPDLQTTIAALQAQAAGAPCAGRPLDTSASPRDFETQLAAGGSKAAAQDLPWLWPLHTQPPPSPPAQWGEVQDPVLHLLLVKKEPRLLLRNNRPILLEAALLRIASSILFGKVMSATELSGFVPPTAFAYMKSPPQHALAILCGWLPAAYAKHGRVWVLDWDESNAFCNVERDGLAFCSRTTPRWTAASGSSSSAALWRSTWSPCLVR